MKSLINILSTISFIFAIGAGFATENTNSLLSTPYGSFNVIDPIGCQPQLALDQNQCGMIDKGFGQCTVTRRVFPITETVDAWCDSYCTIPIYKQTSTGF